ncbi:MAG: FGGY-family carbohydrate kinase [Paracoccaceae bacterium]
MDHKLPYVVAVDVGTKSARAGVFDASGRMLGYGRHEISLWRDGQREGEHSSENIWLSVCDAVRDAVRQSGVAANRVGAIAFDATCSLVLRDGDGLPLPLGPDGRDTIAWFDHRAAEQAAICTKVGGPVLDRLGGTMSPEMQLPKLMWLKQQRPDLWSRLGHAMDLSDFLVSRASGAPKRSLCTMVAKWGYRADLRGWPDGFLNSIGLDDAVDRAGIHHAPALPGVRAGVLLARSAADLGLAVDCLVAQGMVDGYAGALGALAGMNEGTALVAGTSTCVMSVSDVARHGTGIWGPFPDIVLPDTWVSEGGQSATGAALDLVLRRFGDGDDSAGAHDRIARRIQTHLAQSGPEFARNINVLPDFNGNRTPMADPDIGAVMSGLSLDFDAHSLPQVYWRVAVGLAMGLRQIITVMSNGRDKPRRLFVAGGHGRSDLLMQLYANATGCDIARINGVDTVLLGSAMAALATAQGCPLSAVSAGILPDRKTLSPDPVWAAALDHDYAAFTMMQRHRSELLTLHADQSKESDHVSGD